MKMIRIAICDDSFDSAYHIKKLIDECISNYTINYEIAEFIDPQKLLIENTKAQFDVFFLDIDMPNMSGFDVANELRKIRNDVFIIFVTCHSEFVFKSFEYQPFYFIRKETVENLCYSISKVIDKLMFHMSQHKSILLCEGGVKFPIRVIDIIYIESDKHYLNYYVMNREKAIKERGNIIDFELMYSDIFVKIHKRYLVNLRYLTYIDSHNDEIFLSINKKRLPMSRNYKKEVERKYKLYLRCIT